MSGSRLTIITLAVCGLLVATALWQRGQTTSQIRHFWTAQSAHLIQHAPDVTVRWLTSPEASPTTELPWRDISGAPGLIHLRATLVDDRYFQWPAQECPSSDRPAWLMRFADSTGQYVELGIEPTTGRITHRKTGQCVHLIPASQQAIDEYLKQILH